MPKIIKTIFLLIILLSVSFIATYHVQAKTQTTAYFQDNFDGTTLNPTKWSSVLNVNGGTGGSITVTGGSVYLSSYGTSFPCVTSAGDSFPINGDFYIEFTMHYSSVTGLGDGFWVSNTPLVVQKVGDVAEILHVWSDTTYGTQAILLGKATVLPSSEKSNLNIKLEYTNETYFLFVNGALIASEPSQMRAIHIGFGHPPAFYVPFPVEGQWTSFSIDNVNIYQETPELTATPSITNLIINIAGIILASVILTSLILILYRSIKRKPKQNPTLKQFCGSRKTAALTQRERAEIRSKHKLTFNPILLSRRQ
jgi:hypothetical protein